jgi:hypothetical protein
LRVNEGLKISTASGDQNQNVIRQI